MLASLVDGEMQRFVATMPSVCFKIGAFNFADSLEQPTGFGFRHLYRGFSGSRKVLTRAVLDLHESRWWAFALSKAWAFVNPMAFGSKLGYIRRRVADSTYRVDTNMMQWTFCIGLFQLE